MKTIFRQESNEAGLIRLYGSKEKALAALKKQIEAAEAGDLPMTGAIADLKEIAQRWEAIPPPPSIPKKGKALHPPRELEGLTHNTRRDGHRKITQPSLTKPTRTLR